MTESQSARRRFGPVPLPALLVCVLLAACEIQTAGVDPSGRLAVLAPSPGLETDGTADQWNMVTADTETGPRFVEQEIQKVRSLRVTSAAVTGILYRNTDAILAVSPFLSWAWSVEPHVGSQHPVRIIVGFYGGDPESGGWKNRPQRQWVGSDLPPYDRLLTIGWDASALRRGHLTAPRENPRAPRHYTVRGGEENTGEWRLETVDLTDLYRMAWPGDDVSATKIVFIGIAAVGGEPPATANISGLVLSR